MLERAQVEEAVELQRRSYQLVLWLKDAVRRGFVAFDTAHEYATTAESARAWILEHWANIPPRCRPLESKGRGLFRFANVFTSYLETSFELVENPGNVLRTDCGCLCPYCRYAVAASHLRTKKVAAPDKKRARNFARAALEEIAISAGLRVPREQIESMLEDRSTKEGAALIAYMLQLFLRCDGAATGEHVLALWRMFAWNEQGSPKEDFELTVDAVFSAETRLREKLQRS
jgi:hypothetical protein